MHVYQTIVTVLGLTSFGLGLPASDQPGQQPILQPKVDFTVSPVRDALISNKIIGDVLNDFEPSYYIDLVYTKHNVKVSLGNEIAVKDVKKRPQFGIYLIPDASPPKIPQPTNFTLVLTDPDALSRYDPNKSEMCHWILTNITSEIGTEQSIEDMFDFEIEESDSTFEFGDEPSAEKHHKHHKHASDHCKKDSKGGKCLPGEIEAYFPPGPPPKKGWHRYVFVLLVGNTTHLVPPKERTHWGYGRPRHGVRDWAAENGLEVVGANFFFAKNKKQ